MIKDFLQRVKNLPLNELSEADLHKRVDELKESIISVNNPYVMDVLARNSATKSASVKSTSD